MANLQPLNNENAAVALLPGQTPALNLIEQAAIVLLSMGEEQAAGVLRCLERDDLLAITKVMSRMSGIRVDSVRQSLQHFFDDYREQSGVHGASRSFCSARSVWRWAMTSPALCSTVFMAMRFAPRWRACNGPCRAGWPSA